MQKRLLFFLAGLLIFSYFNPVSGAPAIKTPVQEKLPDNTTLTVYLHGDEFFNYTTTEDQYVIAKDRDGFYKYTISDAEGNFIFTPTIARNVTERTSSEKEFLSVLPKGLSETQKVKRKEKISQGQSQRSQSMLRAGSAVQGFPTIGPMKVLVLLVEYQDVRFSQTHEKMVRFFNETGYNDEGNPGSARDFFLDSSHNQYTPDFVVVGPVTLPNEMAYYGGETGRGWQMVTHGCEIAKRDLNVDFSQFDADDNGEVDVVYCLFAGYDRAQGGPPGAVWSHASGVGGVSYDGKRLGRYACSSELRGNWGTFLVGSGTFCHEFGHVLGLPDMYETDGDNNGDCQTPDDWTTMASGGYMNSGKNPPTYTAYERHILNWINLDDYALIQPGEYTLEALNVENKAYKIDTKTPGDFYVLEYKKKTGFDAYLAGEGMLIWHIDRSKTPIVYDGVTTTPEKLWERGAINNIYGHPLYDVVEAVPIGITANTPMNTSVLFPGSSGKTSLTDTSSPNMKSWAGENTEKPISNIRLSSGKMEFDLIAPPDITDNGGIITAKHAILESDPNTNPVNVIDNNISTYYSRFVRNADSYWLQYQSVKNAVVTQYALTSAEVSARDPKSWTFSGSEDGDNWVLLDTRLDEVFPGRKQAKMFKFTNNRPFLYYRLEVTTLNGDMTFQLAEWEIFGHSEPNAPGDLKAVWDKVRKTITLNWKDNSSDEKGFVIERSENGVDFTEIQSVSTNVITFTDTQLETSKRYTYRVKAVIDDLSSVWSNYATASSDLNIANNTDGVASSEYPVLDSNEETNPQLLFDGKASTKYYRQSRGASSYWVQYESGYTALVSGYALTSASSNSGRNPKAWTLSASLDGQTWKVLDAQENQTFTLGENKYYPLSSPGVFKYFRLNITQLNGDIALQLAEWEIFGHAQEPSSVEMRQEDKLVVTTLVSHDRLWTIENITEYPENFVNIYDTTGRIVFSTKGYTNQWNGQGIPSGVYLYEVYFDKTMKAQRGRIVVF